MHQLIHKCGSSMAESVGKTTPFILRAKEKSSRLKKASHYVCCHPRGAQTWGLSLGGGGGGGGATRVREFDLTRLMECRYHRLTRNGFKAWQIVCVDFSFRVCQIRILKKQTDRQRDRQTEIERDRIKLGVGGAEIMQIVNFYFFIDTPIHPPPTYNTPPRPPPPPQKKI